MIIDDFLNKITMYRLVLYVLIFFLFSALVLCILGFLSFSPVSLISSFAILIFFCRIFNKVFAQIFKAPTNVESVYITAFILSLIITPIRSVSEVPFFALVSMLAICSKFLLAISKKHLFNPAALGVFLSFYLFKFGASWWVGNPYMITAVLIGGFLVVRKVRRFSLILSFLLFSLIALSGKNLSQIFPLFINSPLLYFAFIMLTEPQTTPPTKNLQILYGGFVGLSLNYFTPEASLLLGNIFSYLFSSKDKLILTLDQKRLISPQTFDFVFKLNKKFIYKAGQYMEWTLSHQNPDSRGIRRYFTLASSPTEDDLKIGIKFYENSSTFKKALIALKRGDKIVASNLAGEFTLPSDLSKKIVFLAGGIGITPVRSMIKYLLDSSQTRDIYLFYSNKLEAEIVYRDIFEKAKKIGLKVIYINTDQDGYLTKDMILQHVSDYRDRIYYLSGPHSMVDAFSKMLKKDLRLPEAQIKIDFFPGYA